ncbi:MAG: UDP-N-acetylmuramoyl-L-alanyl-D-glutamate--2,6-diaminopimelate ligase [Anaerolineales bacterium]|nr:UDP-N-acetylmuramoyl-L-alanyl-D-glutamate--2,6-diaminopimelate ligase [Chloroflexota bacterium]MBL6982237.1 UDP-N-acetylmuramoyl-L-alanyl-D-glutamate--2,6-diaminopimelate ligase [Anaerolineales bacterium]
MSRKLAAVPLSALIQHLPEGSTHFGEDVNISAIVQDSRLVTPGALFVAVPGLNVDGHQFIPDAIERGAVAVVGTKDLLETGVPYVHVDHAPKALAMLSAAFYDFPARKLTVIGVTGTDGKTTTSNYIFQILKAAGLKVGMISTVNAVIGDQTTDTGFHVTTPEAPDVQRYLAQMADAGVTHVVLEATSHGLAQDRVAACDFDIGVVTNITHEHLDYHGSYQAYQEAKGRLFTYLGVAHSKPHGNIRLAVLNHDDQSYEYLETLSQNPIQQISYGLGLKAKIRAGGITHLRGGLKFNIDGPNFSFDVKTRLLGGYNVSNILAAVGATVVGVGVDQNAARAGIAALEGIPGRMEPIDLGQNFLAIVDFAHTPNALKRALEAARPMTKGKVIAVFGSAGLRDREKRRLMAEVSGELADLTVLTAEDPRTESLDEILAEMAVGAESKDGVEGETFWRVPDRGDAIRLALSMAQPGDVVMACGKGHEQSMCFGEIEYPWDDRSAMRAALSEYLGMEGPEMPELPTSK